MKYREIIAVLAVSASALGQAVAPAANMVTICPENTIITTLPVGTLYQFGTGKTWTPLTATTKTFPKLPFTAVYTAFPFDPAPGIAKVFAVQQTAKVQTIIYTGSNGKPVTVNVPALAPPPTSIFIPGTYTCSKVTIAADSTFSIDPTTCALNK